jgi:hypothetical protein
MSGSRRRLFAVFGSVIALFTLAPISYAGFSLNFPFRPPSGAQLKKAVPASIPKNLRGKHKLFFAIMIDHQGVHALNGDFQDRSSITIGGRFAIVTPAGQRLPSPKILKTYLTRKGIYLSTLEGQETLVMEPKKTRLLDLLKGETSDFFAKSAFRKCTSAEIRSIKVYWVGYHFKNPVHLIFFFEN